MNSNFYFIGWTIPLHCGTILEIRYPETSLEHKHYGPTHVFLPAPICSYLLSAEGAVATRRRTRSWAQTVSLASRAVWHL